MVGQSRIVLDALADLRVLEDIDRLIGRAEMIEDRDRAAREAALREQCRALHEQHDVVRLTISAMRSRLRSLVVSDWHRGFELQCVKLSPYASAKRRIDAWCCLMRLSPAKLRLTTRAA